MIEIIHPEYVYPCIDIQIYFDGCPLDFVLLGDFSS